MRLYNKIILTLKQRAVKNGNDMLNYYVPREI
jgi:hypothetical protein